MERKKAVGLKKRQAKLTQRSTELINQFKSTADSLIANNDELSVIEQEYENTISELNQRVVELQNTKSTNQRVAGNIMQLIAE